MISIVLYAQVNVSVNYKYIQTVFPPEKNANFATGKIYLVLFLILVIKECSVFLPSAILWLSDSAEGISLSKTPTMHYGFRIPGINSLYI